MKKIVFWDWCGTLVLNSDDYQLARNNIANYISYAWALVENFHKLNFVQVITTNGSDEEINPQLKYFPFKNFDLIMTATNFKPKPNGQMFEYALNKFSLKKQEAIFIGDSEVDQQTAYMAMIDFYKVDTSLNSYLKIAKDYGFVKIYD